MQKETKIKLADIIKELSFFMEKDFSSQFRNLSPKEDRQLFFLAKILTQLKNIYKEVNEDKKVLSFPVLHNSK